MRIRRFENTYIRPQFRKQKFKNFSSENPNKNYNKFIENNQNSTNNRQNGDRSQNR